MKSTEFLGFLKSDYNSERFGLSFYLSFAVLLKVHIFILMIFNLFCFVPTIEIIQIIQMSS